MNENSITDMSVFQESGLSSRVVLEINENRISKVRFLSHIRRLRELRLNFNDIDDLSPLSVSGLEEQRILTIARNWVSDLRPLLSPHKLKELIVLRNLLSSTSIEVVIPQLQERGVAIRF